jgi:hypothetical protein
MVTCQLIKLLLHLLLIACLEVNYRIISLFGPSDSWLDHMLESISSNLGIPLISTAPRSSVSGVEEGGTQLTISLHPTQVQLIGLIKDFAVELGWKEVSIIHDPAFGWCLFIQIYSLQAHYLLF